VRRILLFGFALALAAQPSSAQKESKQAEVTQVQIDAAIDRGVAHLLEVYQEGQWRDPTVPPGSPLALLDGPGLRALTTYALLKSGVPSTHPVVEKLVARLSLERIDRTYDVACMLMALEALDPVGQRAWIDELAAWLVAHREKPGDFGYPGNADLSNSQFAALGLRAAAAAGVAIAPDVWADLGRTVLSYQSDDGGFSYKSKGRSPTPTMSVAGVGVLAVCEMGLARCGALDAELAQRMRRARAGGLAWLAKHLDLGRDTGSWHHYLLYGLERAGGLCGVEKIGEHDWYREGAAFLVESQDDAGEWHGTLERSPTLFALLFLSRATSSVATGRSRVAPATGPPPRRFPQTAGTGAVGGARLEAQGTRPLRMWITRLVSPANAPFEWTGERARGPRARLVEYLIDGVTVQVVLGDPACPAGDQRFDCEHRGLAQGRHRVTARVHVRPPEPQGAAAAARPALADNVITTNDVEIEVTEDVPVAANEAWFDPDLDLLLQVRPKATGSSVIAKAPGWEPSAFHARASVDGNPRSPWICAADDARPWLRIHLAKPQRATLVRIAPARLAPRSPDFLTLPREISIAIDGGPPRTVTLGSGAGAWFELRLEKATAVNLLEIKILARDEPDVAAGIGEVVLEHGPD